MHWVRVTYTQPNGQQAAHDVRDYGQFEYYTKKLMVEGLTIGTRWIAPSQIIGAEEMNSVEGSFLR